MTTTLPDPGDRVELIATDDEWTLLRPGARGTVRRVVRTTGVAFTAVDVQWDDGSTLSLIPESGDRWRVVTE